MPLHGDPFTYVLRSANRVTGNKTNYQIHIQKPVVNTSKFICRFIGFISGQNDIHDTRNIEVRIDFNSPNSYDSLNGNKTRTVGYTFYDTPAQVYRVGPVLDKIIILSSDSDYYVNLMNEDGNVWDEALISEHTIILNLIPVFD